MKKLLPLLCGVAATLPVQAQQNLWSVGIRTGLRYDSTLNNNDNRAVFADNRLFVKRHIYRRIEMELNVGLFKRVHRYNNPVFNPSGIVVIDGSVRVAIRDIQVNLGLTYTIIQHKHIQVYGAAGLTSVTENMRTTLENVTQPINGLIRTRTTTNLPHTIYI